MKIRRLFFVLFIVAAFLGCKTPPPPPPPPPVITPRTPPPEPPPIEPVALTPLILERLEAMHDFVHIANYQFVLSGQITLNLVKLDREDHNNRPVAGAVFENVRVRTQITFPNRSLGQALEKNTVGDRYVLRVYFEHPDDESKYPADTHSLSFSARKSEQNAYFYLDYNASRTDTLGEEKGTLKYGADTYTLLFNDEDRPHIALRLERKNNATEERRSPRGREVNQAPSPGNVE
jgi:hypothetical protein